MPLPAHNRLRARTRLQGVARTVAPGGIVLIHVASGATGILLYQWAKHLGVTVIGAVGSAAKAGEARATDADHLAIHGAGDAKRGDLEQCGAELFDALARGAVRPAVNHVYPLAEATEVHRALEARETTGSTVLFPWA